MAGIEHSADGLNVDREPNVLDALAIECSAIFDQHEIDHVFVAGYVAILSGRARATDDIDLIIERTTPEVLSQVADAFESSGFWGPATPLTDIHAVLEEGGRIWIAREDTTTPHLDITFPSDRYHRASLTNSIPARIGDATIPIGPLELQIAYKLNLGGRTDFEDAAHLFLLFEETLSTQKLEYWVEELGVTHEYEQLTTA